MVRCDHCGWSNNPDGAQKCQKCNQELVYRPSDSMEGDAAEKVTALAEGCAKCGYPLFPESAFCPNCGTNVSAQVAQTGDTSMKRTMRDVPSATEPKMLNATPNEHTVNQNLASFRLRPVDMVAPETFAFGTDTDAAFEFADGQWFITDKSGTQSTYVCASRRIALQKGDIVLIGGRRYKFE